MIVYLVKQVANDFNFNHREIIIEPQIIDLLPKLIYHLEGILLIQLQLIHF